MHCCVIFKACVVTYTFSVIVTLHLLHCTVPDSCQMYGMGGLSTIIACAGRLTIGRTPSTKYSRRVCSAACARFQVLGFGDVNDTHDSKWPNLYHSSCVPNNSTAAQNMESTHPSFPTFGGSS